VIIMRTAIAACVLCFCIVANAAEPALDPSHDYHSYSNPEALRVEHADLALSVDFPTRRLSGAVDLRLVRVDPQARELVLDTRDLDIRSVWLVGGEKLVPLEFSLAPRDPILGSALRIRIPADAVDALPTSDRLVVRLSYETAPGASGLQWLPPELTAGRQHPFLFTQSQAIHARSWIPLQDTPQVRMTYRAEIHAPPGLSAMMSAQRSEQDGVFIFEMQQPIPSYLMALAVGDLAFRPIGDRTGVYAEPSVVEAAQREFADTQAMLEAAEKLYGPYCWDRYDILILPPSFPFGGMENPRLSFITPTVIAGDRSLVAVIAHELAHSWSGNLVTNATWRDVWLNEGFTTFLERQIIETIYGQRRRDMEDVLGLRTLKDDFDTLEPRDELLTPDLRGRDPDDNFSQVAYEKGYLFLKYLETKVGRERFAAFLREYFAEFSFRSLTTDQFLEYLQARLLEQVPDAVSKQQLHAWLSEPALPTDAVLPKSDALQLVDAQRKQWQAGKVAATALQTKEWSTQEWLHFLDNLPAKLKVAQMKELDDAFGLTQAGNALVAHSWLRVVIRNHYEPALPRLETYLTTIGRRILIRPLYEDLMKSEWGTTFARSVYEKARLNYHPMAVATLDPIVLPKAAGTRNPG